MKFKNTEKFFAWIDEVLATKLRALYSSSTEAGQAHFEDVVRQYGETGINIFEMPSLFTKSGNPECIRFDVEEIDNQDGTFTTIISF